MGEVVMVCVVAVGGSVLAGAILTLASHYAERRRRRRAIEELRNAVGDDFADRVHRELAAQAKRRSQ